ncbi:MAG: SAM-dependent methyltransferase [Woeseiaceae bacterium]
MQAEPKLPQPDASSAAHSERVAAYVRDRIAEAGGAISFAEYMHHVLYAPGLGYYSAGTAKFGAGGDFVTAPEVSPLFGRVLARQCAEAMSVTGTAEILEFGAGTGRLAVDLVGKLEELHALPARYRIVEVSAELRARQRELIETELPGHTARVEWLDGMPESYSGIVVANEVLDAMPVERFVRRADGIAQIRVTDAGGRFECVEGTAPDFLAAAVMAIEAELGRSLPAGYVSEVNTAAPAWIADLSDCLDEGCIFVFDYGVSRREYYALERSGGWLRCHYRHRVHDDPLLFPGIQDLTAWVDFTGVAAAAVDKGLAVAGYVSQAQFLLAGGLAAELAGMAELPTDAQLELSRQVKLLTLPSEMGENFKCLGLSRDAAARTSAFGMTDRTVTL